MLFDSVLPHTLQDIEGAVGVGREVNVGIFHRVPNAGAGGEVKDSVELVGGEEAVEGGEVFDIQRIECK